MTLYHGTTMDAATAIRRQGLKAVAGKRLDVCLRGVYSLYCATDWLARGDDNILPKVTSLRETAVRYANLRADYMFAPVNGRMRWGNSLLIKRSGRQVKVRPTAVIVKFDVPETWAEEHLSEDQRDYEGLESDVTIPAAYVAGVEVV